MKSPIRPRSSTVIIVLGVAVTLGVLTQMSASKQMLVSKKTHTPTKIVLVSETGEHIESFFAGLPPVKPYVDGKMYWKAAVRPGCVKQLNVFERIAVRLGVERVARAQISCNQSTCNGCYIKIIGGFCTGPCEGGYWQETSGGACSSGFTLSGPSCGVDNGCGCNATTCDQTSNCGC